MLRRRREARTAWGSIQEASALLDTLQVFPRSTVHEVGLCMVDPRAWGFSHQELPPVGSSPDGLLYHPPCDGGSDADAEYRELALPGQWEAVEVKNHCPFASSVRTSTPPLSWLCGVLADHGDR